VEDNTSKDDEPRVCAKETLEARACGAVASLSARIACEQPLDEARSQLPNTKAFEVELVDKCRTCMRNVMAGKSVPEPIIPNTSRHNVERALTHFMETGTSDDIPSLLLVSSSSLSSSSNEKTTTGNERHKSSFWQKWLPSGK
jgi:hypothetical protein